MQVEIIQEGRVLRRLEHNGGSYVEAPASGEYEIRLTNNSPNRRLAVLSVDGLNVVDGKDAGFKGSGFVLGPWESLPVKGFLRSGAECARFTFASSEGSYANRTGRGKKNTGVVGVAVFDEVPKPVVILQPPLVIEHHHHHPWRHPDRPWRPGDLPGRPWPDLWCSTFGASTPTMDSHTMDSHPVGPTMSTTSSTQSAGATLSADKARPRGTRARASAGSGVLRSAKRGPVTESAEAAPDLGTAYGRAEAFHTQTTEFKRASDTPSFVVTLRYAVTAKLREWGVPVDVAEVRTESPNAFPAATGYAAPPPGWGG